MARTEPTAARVLLPSAVRAVLVLLAIVEVVVHDVLDHGAVEGLDPVLGPHFCEVSHNLRAADRKRRVCAKRGYGAPLGAESNSNRAANNQISHTTFAYHHTIPVPKESKTYNIPVSYQ